MLHNHAFYFLVLKNKTAASESFTTLLCLCGMDCSPRMESYIVTHRRRINNVSDRNWLNKGTSPALPCLCALCTIPNLQPNKKKICKPSLSCVHFTFSTLLFACGWNHEQKKQLHALGISPGCTCCYGF